MNPNASQSSINWPFNSSTLACHGCTLPRSFRPHHHENRAYGPFPGLLMAHLGPNRPFHRKRAYGPFESLFQGLSCCPNQSLLGLSSVRGNSRARGLSVIRGSQTRLCRTHVLAGRICWVLSFVCEFGAERR